MNKIIDILRLCSLREITELEIMQQIYKLGNIPGITQMFPPGIIVVRARGGWGYKSRQELSYNPHINHYGRANIPGFPMFYGSISLGKCDLNTLRPLTAQECGLIQNGQKITFGIWKTMNPINVVIFPSINNISMNDNPAYNLYRIQAEVELKKAPEYAETLRFFSSEFCKEVREGNEYEYKITAVLSSFLMCNKTLDGIMYPSVKASGKYGFNLAIKPESVDSKMVLEYSSEHHVSFSGGCFIIHEDKVCRMMY